MGRQFVIAMSTLVLTASHMHGAAAAETRVFSCLVTNAITVDDSGHLATTGYTDALVGSTILFDAASGLLRRKWPDTPIAGTPFPYAIVQEGSDENDLQSGIPR